MFIKLHEKDLICTKLFKTECSRLGLAYTTLIIIRHGARLLRVLVGPQVVTGSRALGGFTNTPVGLLLSNLLDQVVPETQSRVSVTLLREVEAIRQNVS
jgi:hypothetical protein